VSRIVPPEFALQGLLHDAAEAYLGDVSTPLKQLIPEYKVIEHRVERVICQAFDLPFPLDPSIKQADLRMLVTEKRDLMPRPTKNNYTTDEEAWFPFFMVDPLEQSIEPMSASRAKRAFLDRYAELIN
jgi:5'-deoxynucleotidase YfbR-like HD superfamily hydrolase